MNRNCNQKQRAIQTIYPTRLIDAAVNVCTDAPEMLGKRIKKDGIQLVPVVFTPIARRIVIVIPNGFVGLVNRWGKYVGQYGAGYKIAPPWTTISHLIPRQFIIYDTPVKECPTRDNVMVTIDVTLVLRIRTEDEKSCYNFCYKLGPRGLDEMLKAFQEEAIRGMVRARKYNEIYDLINSQQDKQFEKLRRELNDHFHQFGVTISCISVKNVHLPKTFADNMQQTTIWKSRNEYQSLKQKYEIRKIEIRENELDEKSNTTENLDQFTVEKETELAALLKKKKLVLAQTDKQLAQIKEQQDADALHIKSNSNLVVAELNKKADIQTSKIQSIGISEAETIKIESGVYIQTQRAKAQTQIAGNNAIGLEIEANAEKYACNELIAKRLYKKKMRSIQMLNGLCTNDNVAISGNSKDNITAQLVANQRGCSVLCVDQ